MHAVSALSEAFGGLLRDHDPPQPSCIASGPEQPDKENAAPAQHSLTPSRLQCFKALREELTCAVCLDVCVRPCTTPCGHSYCRACLRRNLELNHPCPKCRARVPAGFSLTVNTTLWNTIQHLFPAEASSKPLTPPPPPPQQQHGAHNGQAGRVPRAPANGNPSAPFRPPRFLAAAQAPFSGSSSSRANAAAAAARLAAGGGGMGLSSLSGRSMSGPRGNMAAPPPPPAAAAAAASSGVQSLAELGMRRAAAGGGGGGGAGAAVGRQARRRSRSAERWEGEPSPMGAGEEAGGAAAAGLRSWDGRMQGAGGAGAAAAGGRAPFRPPASASSSAASSSVLLGLLAGAPARRASRDAAAAAAPAAPAASSAATSAAPPQPPPSNLTLNPFARTLRPTQPRAPAPTPSQGGGAGAAAGRGGMTASQRAMLATRAQLSGCGAPDGSASGSGGSGTLSAASGPAQPPRASAASRSTSNAGSGGSSAPSSPASSSSSSPRQQRAGGALDDPSALDLLPEVAVVAPLAGFWGRPLPQRLGPSSSGECANGAGRSGAVGSVDASEDQAGAWARTERSDTGLAAARDQTPRTPAAPPARAPAPSAAAPGGRPTAAPPPGDDDTITLDGLDLLSPGSPEHRASTRAPAYVGPGAGASAFLGASQQAATAAAAGSPSWQQLDAMMASALRPLDLSPPSLPRLRLRPTPAPAPAPASPSAHASPERQPAQPVGASLPAAALAPLAAGRVDPDPDTDLDPDRPSNYDDCDDPAAADSFFSSPFFDRTMLWEAVGAGRAGAAGGGGAAGEAALGASRAASGSQLQLLQRLDSASALSDFGGGDSAGAGGAAMLTQQASLGARRAGGTAPQPVPGAAEAGPPSPPLLCSQSEGANRGVLEARTSLSWRQRELRTLAPLRPSAARARGRGAELLAAGDDAGCPIDLLSDSD